MILGLKYFTEFIKFKTPWEIKMKEGSYEVVKILEKFPEDTSMDSVSAIRNVFSNHFTLTSLRYSILGFECSIPNEGVIHPYLFIADNEENNGIIFLYEFRLNDSKKTVAMFCMKNGIVYEYKDVKDNSLFSSSSYLSLLNKIVAGKRFLEGTVGENITKSDNEIMKELIDFIKND